VRKPVEAERHLLDLAGFNGSAECPLEPPLVPDDRSCLTRKRLAPQDAVRTQCVNQALDLGASYGFGVIFVLAPAAVLAL
jgi:hypothetical protein